MVYVSRLWRGVARVLDQTLRPQSEVGTYGLNPFHIF